MTTTTQDVINGDKPDATPSPDPTQELKRRLAAVESSHLMVKEENERLRRALEKLKVENEMLVEMSLILTLEDTTTRP